MIEADKAPPLRVEQALRLVPRSELLAPLRALLVSASRPDERRAWSSSAPYLTFAKRGVELPVLRIRLDMLLRNATRHMSEQYEAALTVLDRFGRGEPGASVTALLDAGRREERIGRPAAARAWYAVALELAESLPDRRPEVGALLLVAAIDRQSGAFADAARRYQRSLALAEAEPEDASALRACIALGAIALMLGNFGGARAWYTRGLRRAQGTELPAMTGRVLLQLAELALLEGRIEEAPDLFGRARTCFRPEQDAADLARLLRTQGLLHEKLGDRSAAADYREALMWALKVTDAPELELSIRLHLARLHFRGDRALEAEEEMRRAEQHALAEGLSAWLVRVYVLMGDARARARDEQGFVFFEQAIELCHSIECASLLEAGAYRAYGDFREALGDQDAARAYFERGSEILKSLGAGVDPAALRTGLLL